MDEDAAANTAVGSPVTAINDANNTLTYSISGDSHFTIDSGTGQIRMADGMPLNRAAAASHMVTVGVSDGRDSTGAADPAMDDRADVTIHVANSDSPPVPPSITIEGPESPILTSGPFTVTATFSEEPGAYYLATNNLAAPLNAQTSGNVVTFTDVQPQYYTGRWGTWPYQVRIRIKWRGLHEIWEATYDPDPPRVHRISGPAETQRDMFTVGILLTETAVGFTVDDLDVVNGEATALRRTGAWNYEADIRPAANGLLTVDIAAGAFQDGRGRGNTAAQQYSVQVDLSPRTPGAPRMPQSLIDPTTMLDVIWAAPQIVDGPAITGYDVEYQDNDATEWHTHALSVTNTITTLRNLAKGTTYQSRVRARNVHGVSQWSDPGEGSTWENLPPATVWEIEFGRKYLDIICDPKKDLYPGAGGYQDQNVIIGGTRLSPQQLADPTPADFFVVLDASCVDGDNVSIRGMERESDFEWTWQQTGSANFLPYYILSGGGFAGTKRSKVKGSAISFDCGNDGWRPPHGEYKFVVTVTKNGEFYQKQFVSFTIGNPPPPAGAGGSGDPAPELTADAGPDLTGAPGQSVTLQGTGSTNPYGEWWEMEQQWTQLSGPDITLSDASVGNPSFTLPDDAEEGTTLEFQLTVTDKEGKSDSDTVTVTVLPKLAACAGPDLAGAPGGQVTLQGRCSTNPYGKWYKMAHSWRQLSGPTVTLDKPTHGDPSFTLPADAADGTTLEFQLTVTDQEGQSDSDTMIVTVAAAGTIRPTATAGPDLTGAPGDSVTLQGRGSTNPYGKWYQMTHLWTQMSGPAVTLSDPTKGDPSFTVPSDAAGGTTLEFQLTVTDKEDQSDSDTMTVTVTGDVPDTNAPPVFDAGPSAAFNLPENTAAGENVGLPLTATDPDDDTLTYSLSGDDAGSFDLNAATGQLTTRESVTYDYESKPTYAVTVTAEDPEGASASISVTVSLTDVEEAAPNQAPVFDEGDGATRTLAENTAAGVNVGLPLTATNPDDDTLTYSLSSDDAGSFDLNAATGQLTTKEGVTYDYEAKQTYAVTVTAEDPEGASASINVTVSLTDVEEAAPNQAPVFDEGDGATRTLAENTAAGVNVGLPLTATDPDDDTLTYSLSGDDAGSFDLNAATGQLTTGEGVTYDYEANQTYAVTVTAEDPEGASASINVTVSLTDANDPPVFDAGPSAAFNLPENTAAGENVGLPLTATDPDDDTLTYSLSGADAGSFDLNAATAQLTTKEGVTYDYEAKQTYAVTVTAEDPEGASASINVTVSLTDVEEPTPEPEPTPVTSCFTNLNELTAGAEFSGAWDDPDCRAHHQDSSARYIHFTLSEETEVSITLTPESGGALFVSKDTPKNGWGTPPKGTYEDRRSIRRGNGKLVHDGAHTGLNSVALTLAAGDYTAEAAGSGGTFTLSIEPQ